MSIAQRNYTTPLYKGDWEVVIGMEVHAQVISQSKLFSGASAAFGAEPNSQVSFVDMAFPGMLPVINAFCVDQAIKTGLGLNAQINLWSRFDRKNYFYPDLPAGYQISQFYSPIIGPGWVNVRLDEVRAFGLRINHIHLEQDAGKSFHDQHPHKSYIDLNRAGIALMEIVTEPDMRSKEEASAFLRTLRTILRYLGTCDGNMEEGSLRADVNVSIRRPNEALGTRVEVKNINSSRFVEQAVEFEVFRQIELLENGEKVIQETRLFNSSTGETRSMRSKEDAQDYRYMPDPDLPPLILSEERVESIRKTLPELPDSKLARLQEDYGLSYYDAALITSECGNAAYYEECLVVEAEKSGGKVSNEKAKMLANWFTGDLFAYLNKAGLDLSASKISPTYLVELVDLICDGTISGKIAKDVFDLVWSSGESPAAVVEKQGMRQVTDSAAIEAVISKVISQNQDKVQEYRSGKDKLFGFFVGQVMKETEGKANPQMVNDILKDRLSTDS
ncbi:MAG: Asp-tRNA(Asn)/Glu-tRNA(Gln) amidotransferase subunit GatB [Holosporales bacterium]|jgi:aspartyl-tRNA(Asn)/glutamyl-tRNA(Gln) amidotransferase subunit B|nr:Asp-tRNA(Asn)/Glu-tRNA(Gln) amidotransferase subunit GatB [Holosporales bacterium]